MLLCAFIPHTTPHWPYLNWKNKICKILRGGVIMLHFGVNSFVARFKYNVVSNALEHWKASFPISSLGVT